MKYYTPLRYPGGKGKLAFYLKEIIKINELFDKTITNQNPENDRNFRFGEI